MKYKDHRLLYYHQEKMYKFEPKYIEPKSKSIKLWEIFECPTDSITMNNWLEIPAKLLIHQWYIKDVTIEFDGIDSIIDYAESFKEDEYEKFNNHVNI